jgi:hypothetical protein
MDSVFSSEPLDEFEHVSVSVLHALMWLSLVYVLRNFDAGVSFDLTNVKSVNFCGLTSGI